MHPRILASLLLLSCCSPDRDAPSAGGAEAAGPPTDAPIRRRASFVAAMDGGVGLFDAVDGHVLSRADLDKEIDDLLLDAPRGRVVSFEVDPDEEGGELWARPLGALAEGVLLGQSAGIVRFAAAAPHVVVFEDAYGPRWRALDGRRSVFAPPPRSTWTSAGRLHALTFEPEGRWSLRKVGLDGAELSAMELGKAPSLRSEAARVVAFGDRLVAFEVLAGKLSIDGVDSGVSATQVVDACVLSKTSYAVLLGGPTRLLVGSEAGARASLPLPGAPRVDHRYLSHALVPVHATRLLVGTTQRVVAVDLSGDTPALDPAFADQGAHAPIDGPL